MRFHHSKKAGGDDRLLISPAATGPSADAALRPSQPRSSVRANKGHEKPVRTISISETAAALRGDSRRSSTSTCAQCTARRHHAAQRCAGASCPSRLVEAGPPKAAPGRVSAERPCHPALRSSTGTQPPRQKHRPPKSRDRQPSCLAPMNPPSRSRVKRCQDISAPIDWQASARHSFSTWLTGRRTAKDRDRS